jgi:membrane protease subunit (stomatin/prohibitin family)
MLDIFKKQFIEVIEWTENTDGVLAHRFPTADKEIQTGAQLTVRDSQTWRMYLVPVVTLSQRKIFLF